MAPSRQNQAPPYAKDEKVLCFHGDLMYEAKIMEVSVKPGQKPEDAQYRIHYRGWKASWDDWVSQDRIRKFTEDNKQLASQLQAQARIRTSGPKGGKKGAKANGSEMSSARGSEERVAGSSSFGGRGPRRGRDYELENSIPSKWTATIVKPTAPSKDGVKSLIIKMKAIAESESTHPPKIDIKAFMQKEARWARQQTEKDPLLCLPDKWGKRKLNIVDEVNHKRVYHPKIREAEKNDTLTPQKTIWYQDMPRNVNIPVAGIASDKPYRPKLHMIMGYSPLTTDYSPTFLDGNEDNFHTRPSIKLAVPDILKAILVDDWENVTKNNQLVPLPHPHPVSEILAKYAEYETPKRPAGSSHVDILEETLAGLKEYFDKSLGRILLYRFERGQYAEVYKKWHSDDAEFQGKSPSDTYGPEHLMRLIVSLPELVAQTNMDQQSVNRLREELMKFCAWLSKNTAEFFVSHYESPPQDYIQKAKE
ncbi:hypothetical protein ABKA04_003308 [Annulohypoxylon sp. FPYF3050]